MNAKAGRASVLIYVSPSHTFRIGKIMRRMRFMLRGELERGLRRRRRRLLHCNGRGGGSRQEVMFFRLGVPSLAIPKSANGRNKTGGGDGERPKRLDGRTRGAALALIRTGASAAAADGAIS